MSTLFTHELEMSYVPTMALPRKAYHHGELRDALLEAAEALLEKDGPTGLSLRKLGRQLGVTPGAPYRHFEDKDGLLAALATGGFQRLRQMMLDAQKGATDAEDRLRRAGVGYLEFASKHPELFRLMFGWMPPREAPELYESGDAAFAVLEEVLAACEEEGLLSANTRDAGLLAWSSVHGAAFLLIDDGLKLCDLAPDPKEVANRLHDGVWAGIGRR